MIHPVIPNRKALVMKRKLLAFGLLTLLASFSTGCLPATAHSGGERWQKIAYNMSIDGAQLQDDLDHFWLMRDGATMSYWNIQYQ